MNDTPSLHYPALLLIRGLPGSGKSYIAEAVADVIGRDRVLMLDPDSIDRESAEYLEHSEALAAQGIEQKFHPYKFLRSKAHQAITDHKIIIWNQPFTSPSGFNKTVMGLQGYAEKHGLHLPTLSVEVEISHETAKARVMQRRQEGGHGPSDNTFQRFIDDYTTLPGETYKTIAVHGEQDVSASVAAIMEALHELSV